MNPLGFAIAAALGNIVGALAVVRHERRSLQAIDAGLAFGAGFMLAVAVLGMMPEVLRDNPSAALYVLFGYLAVHLAQHVFTPHFHFGEETHTVTAAAGMSALLASRCTPSSTASPSPAAFSSPAGWVCSSSSPCCCTSCPRA